MSMGHLGEEAGQRRRPKGKKRLRGKRTRGVNLTGTKEQI